MKASNFFLILILLAITLRGNGQPPLPGNPELPTSSEELQALTTYAKDDHSYKVADFMAYPLQSDFQLSPNGRYLSYLEKDSLGERWLQVRDLQTDEITKVLAEGEESIRDHFWKNEERLVYLSDQGSNELYQLFAVNRDGTKALNLTPFENMQLKIVDHLVHQPRQMLIEIMDFDPQQVRVLQVDVYNGDLVEKAMPELVLQGGADYYCDPQGNLRAFDHLEGFREYVLYYHSSEDSIYKEVNRNGFDSWFQICSYLSDPQHPDQAYVLSNRNHDTKALYRYDLKKRQVLEKISTTDQFDIEKVHCSPYDGSLEYYTYQGIQPQVVPLCPATKMLHQRVLQRFPGMSYQIAGWARTQGRFLLKISSDRVYGKYYLYDQAQDHWQLLSKLKPQLQEEDLVKMEPFHFQSRDSLALSGYYLRPPEASAEHPVPIVLIPHGGPYDLRDQWEFVDYAQLFASRGYGVLFVNFRGSIGFGKKFLLQGHKQVGRKIIDDLEDGLAAVLEQGWADPERLILFGASHGGLATLQYLMRKPSGVVCAIDLMGPTNLFSLFENFPAFWQHYLTWFYTVWYNPKDTQEAEIIRAISPYFHLDRIQKPLLVVHGANDPRVSIAESDQLVEGLRALGKKVPYFVKYNEGHGWTHEENIVELMEVILGFMAKHLANSTVKD